VQTPTLAWTGQTTGERVIVSYLPFVRTKYVTPANNTEYYKLKIESDGTYLVVAQGRFSGYTNSQDDWWAMRITNTVANQQLFTEFVSFPHKYPTFETMDCNTCGFWIAN
ncbi:unnamed protein product, partial [Rotaria sp. Silwood2]